MVRIINLRPFLTFNILDEVENEKEETIDQNVCYREFSHSDEEKCLERDSKNEMNVCREENGSFHEISGSEL